MLFSGCTCIQFLDETDSRLATREGIDDCHDGGLNNLPVHSVYQQPFYDDITRMGVGLGQLRQA